MREGAKKRLAGSVAIVALAAIFVPMLFEEKTIAPPVVVNTPPTEPQFNTSLDDILINDTPPEINNPIIEDQYADNNSSVETDTRTRTAPNAADFNSGGVVPELNVTPQRSRATLSPATDYDVPKPPPVRTTNKPKQIKPSPEPEEFIATPKPKQADKKGSWVIQVASLGNEQTAADLKNKLRKAGFAAFIEKAEVRGKQYYRVRVGPNKSRASAERAASKLRNQQKLETFIQRQP
jgi:DedD protein